MGTNFIHHNIETIKERIILEDKLGLSWAKLSSNWNWNGVLLDLSFVALN